MKTIINSIIVLLFFATPLTGNAQTSSTACGTSPDLIACYLFDNNLEDGVNKGGDLDTLVGGTYASDRHGASSSCVELSGVGQYISGDFDQDGFTQGTFSLSIWFKNAENVGRYQAIIDKSEIPTIPVVHTTAYEFFSLRITPNTLPTQSQKILQTKFSDGNKELNLLSLNQNVCDNKWHHAVVVLDTDNDKAKMYVDTICVDSTSLGGFKGFTGNNVLGIGSFFDKNGKPDGGVTGGSGIASSFYKGFLDDLRIYRSALSSSDIKTLFLGSTATVSVKSPNNFKLYPNPATSEITIESAALINSLSIEALDGSIVHSQKDLTSSTYSYNISELAAGIYYITIDTDLGVETRKFSVL